MDALTVTRGKIFEVEYSLRVAVDSGARLSSDIQITLPIRIVGFHSIDPPPSKPIGVQSVTPFSSRPPSPGHSSKTNTLSQSHPLSYPRNSKETQNQISTGQFKTNMDDSNILLCNSHRQDTHEPFSGCSGELGNFELGNLSLADDTDNVVQHAITTARMNSVYGNFSDLYYLEDKTNQIEIDGASRDDKYEHSIDDLVSEPLVRALETPTTNVYDAEVTVHRRSSFAARVEEKTRIATTTFLNEDHDACVYQEQQDTLKYDKAIHITKPHLTLKHSPTLCGEINQSPGDALHHQFNGFGGAPIDSWKDENSFNVPTQSDRSHSPGAAKAGPKRHRQASTIDPSISATSSQTSICLLPAPLFYQGQPYLTTTTSAPICSRCAIHMSDSPSSRGNASSTGRQSTPASDSEPNDDVNSPCVDYSTIGIAKAATVSAPVLISPTNTTSTTSAASVGSVSVKDKVRQLEERVKASTSLLI